jgi:hypothetical protein
MRYKGKATSTIVASEKYLSPNSNEMIALKMINRLLSARIVYVFFNKLGVGSTSLKLKMTSSFFNPRAAMYFFKLVYLRHLEGKY